MSYSQQQTPCLLCQEQIEDAEWGRVLCLTCSTRSHRAWAVRWLTDKLPGEPTPQQALDPMHQVCAICAISLADWVVEEGMVLGVCGACVRRPDDVFEGLLKVVETEQKEQLIDRLKREVEHLTTENEHLNAEVDLFRQALDIRYRLRPDARQVAELFDSYSPPSRRAEREDPVERCRCGLPLSFCAQRENHAELSDHDFLPSRRAERENPSADEGDSDHTESDDRYSL